MSAKETSCRLQGGQPTFDGQMDRIVPLQEIEKHGTVDDAWIVIDGKVYNVSSYVATHPGGEAILKNVGGDATEGFHHQPAHRVVKNHIASLLEKFYVGLLVIEKENFDEQP